MPVEVTGPLATLALMIAPVLLFVLLHDIPWIWRRRAKGPRKPYQRLPGAVPGISRRPTPLKRSR